MLMWATRCNNFSHSRVVIDDLAGVCDKVVMSMLDEALCIGFMLVPLTRVVIGPVTDTIIGLVTSTDVNVLPCVNPIM